ncbi:MAG: enoyl-CoA hydratase [Pseudonocardia sp. SCN 72-86]|nr:MAG: enoyl-CoA hydratase [Pseudonocardia sp. SCN 72-86]
MADLEYTVADGIGRILLNRPERKNAFTLDMIDSWVEALVSARTDPGVRVVLVTGAGGAFCSGMDLGGMRSDRSALDTKTVLMDRVHRVALALQDLDKPVVAAVDGVAVGAGMDMALMCDLRVCSTSARFSEGYVKVGLVPGDGGCYFLPRIVGTARALELLWTGDMIDADEAHRIGLVNHVYPQDSFEQQAGALVCQLADGPPVAISMIKRATYQSVNSDLRTALDLISSHMSVVRSTADSHEAMAAFRERRTPTFHGR